MPTQDEITWYAQGYADAKAGRAPAVAAAPSPVVPVTPAPPVAPAPAPKPVAPVPTPAPPIAVGPTPAPVRVIQPTDDLAKLFGTLTGTTNALQFAPGKAFTIPTPLQGSAPYSLNANHCPLTFRVSAGSSLFKVMHPATKIFNVNAPIAPNANAVLFYVQGDGCEICNFAVGDGFGSLVKSDTGGTNANVHDGTVGKTNSVAIYFCENGDVARRISVAGSIGETTCRVDSGATVKQPNGIIFDSCIIGSVGGANAKGSIEWRYAGTGCQFTNNESGDYLRAGQDGTDPAGGCIGNLLISGNRWMKLPPAAIQNYLMFKGGIIADVVNNDFLVNAAFLIATMSGNSNITFKGNRRHLSAAGIKPQAKFYNPANVPASIKLVDDGGMIAA